MHDDSMVTNVRRTRLAEGGREEIRKPAMVEEYNKYMGVWTRVTSSCLSMGSRIGQ